MAGESAEARGNVCQREACDPGLSVRVDGGQLVGTTNGVDWVERSVPTPSRLRCVARGRGMFVAVRDEGALVTSRDEVRWTLRDSATDERLRCIVYAQNLFVAVGYGGTIITSRDAVTWKRRNSTVPDRLQGIAYGNGAFVAVGWNGGIVTSRDGQRWTPRPRLEGRLQSVVFRNGVFATSNPQGANWISRNGITWQAASSATDTRTVGAPPTKGRISELWGGRRTGKAPQGRSHSKTWRMFGGSWWSRERLGLREPCLILTRKNRY